MRPSVLMRRNLQALSIIPAGARVCRQRHLVLPGSPGDPCMGALLPSEAGEVAMLPTVQIKAPEATLGIWVPPERCPLAAGIYCWDKSALRLAFIFSSRFTRWPLLTSSSSVLSSAERSSLWSFRFSAFSSSSIFSAFSAADL